MAKKRLDISEIDKMKNMVLKGVYPEDIAQHFNIAVSSVHNYKKRFKDEGLDFPSVKGKRPSNSIKPKDTLNPQSQQQKTNVVGVVNTRIVKEQYRFIINGISIEISPEAKYVNIGKDFMEIKF